MKELITEKYCTKCHELKPIGEYYIQRSKKDKPMAACKECEKKKHIYYRNELCLYKVKDKPGEYFNQTQKDTVFEFLKNLKWRYSERTSTWYKSGIKNKYGKWYKLKGPEVNAIKLEKDEYNRQYREKHKKPKPVVEKPKFKKVFDHKAANKKWRDANKDHLKAYRDAHKEYARQYRKDHLRKKK